MTHRADTSPTTAADMGEEVTGTGTAQASAPTSHGELLPEPVTCFGLQSAMSRVLPHRDTGEYKIPALSGVLLDSVGQNLFVVATDRYTLAVARVRTDAPASARPWRLLLDSADTDVLAEMLASTDREEPVHLSEEYMEDGAVLSVDSRYRNTFLEGVQPYDFPAPTSGFPNWREIASRAMGDEASGSAPMPALDAQLLGTWQQLETPVTFHPPRSTDARSGQASRAVVVTSDDFLGLHMPAISRRAETDVWSAPADWLPTLSSTLT